MFGSGGAIVELYADRGGVIADACKGRLTQYEPLGSPPQGA
jgi:hypothetical protein